MGLCVCVRVFSWAVDTGKGNSLFKVILPKRGWVSNLQLAEDWKCTGGFNHGRTEKAKFLFSFWRKKEVLETLLFTSMPPLRLFPFFHSLLQFVQAPCVLQYRVHSCSLYHANGDSQQRFVMAEYQVDGFDDQTGVFESLLSTQTL